MTSVVATCAFSGTASLKDSHIRRRSRAPSSGLKPTPSFHGHGPHRKSARSNFSGPVLGFPSPSADCSSSEGRRLCSRQGFLNGVLRGRKRSDRNAVRNESNSSSTDVSEQELGKSDKSGKSEESHMDTLERMTRGSSGLTAAGKTIAEQLAVDTDTSQELIEEFSVRLGSGKVELDASDLTVSQKRNIRRQNYMNQVSRRNDSRFFTIVGLFVLLPPVVILGLAVANGYIVLPR